MKRMMKLWSIVAVAAMGLVACQNNFEEPTTNVDIKNSVTVSFVSESARTSVDTSGDTPLFSWNESETFAVLEQTDALAKATSVAYTKVDGKANIDAEFAVNEGKSEYKYIAVYPESGYVSASNINAATLALPANQTAVEGSYDPNADLMVSLPIATNAQPTDVLPLRFTRLAAVVEMSLKNFALEAGDAVEKIIFTAKDKSLAGSVNADLTNPHEFTVNEGVSSVEVATTSAEKVYFTVLPTTLNAGNEYSIMVLTNKKFYIKTGTIPEGKSLAFEAGKVTRFGVNLSGARSSDRWELVRDASTLRQGDIVAIVAKDYDKALSKKLYSNASETSTSAKRGVAEISKLGDFLIASADVQPLTLMTGVAEGTFSFYDEARNKFLVSTTTGSTYLINQVYCDVNTSFAITIDNTTTAATITNTEGEYKGNLLRYHTTGYFVSNQNDSSVYKDVCIYRLGGVVGDIPVVAAVVTVPDSDEPVTIAEEGAQSATAIEEVVFNYVGDWAISVSDNAEWLAVAYDAENKKVTYTAEANVGAKRDAVVTITASLEGQEPLTWSFNLLQKGAPQEISIADFMEKGKDENSTYKLTGRITEVSTSSSGTYKITDGTNVATITYLFTDGGSKVCDDTTIGLKVGDVVTLTTVVTSTTKGKGGSGTYHSIYKGHYRLEVEPGLAVDYKGGSVDIEVKTSSNGNIVLPAGVEGNMTECDYATFTYSGGDTATVTFPNENTTSDALEATVKFTYGEASASVTVQQGVNPANKLGWELVTDASTLAVGDEVIIVAKNADKALACPTKTSDTKFPSADIEKTGNVIYDIEKAGVQPFTLVAGTKEGTKAFEFSYKDAVYYPYYSSGLKMRTSVNEQASWTIEIDANGEATISTVSSSKYYLIKFNSATSSLTFTSYLSTASGATKTENAVSIYKKQVK